MRSLRGLRSWKRRSAIEAATKRISAVERGPIAFSVAFAIRWVPAERIWFRTSARMTRRFVSMDAPAWTVAKIEARSVPRRKSAI
jgi:hypothetical protein